MRNVILGAVVAFFLAQCATVTRGPFQNIRVGSKPAGATVQFSECGVGSQASVKTPATVFVNRRATRTKRQHRSVDRSSAVFRTKETHRSAK